MKFSHIVLSQYFIGFLAMVAIWVFNAPQNSWSFAVGLVVSSLSLLSFYWAAKLVFVKKLFALAIGIIVFKYTIFGVIIYIFLQQKWMSPLWLGVGVSSIAVAGLLQLAFLPKNITTN